MLQAGAAGALVYALPALGLIVGDRRCACTVRLVNDQTVDYAQPLPNLTVSHQEHHNAAATDLSK